MSVRLPPYIIQKYFLKHYLYIFPWSVTGHHFEYPKVIVASTCPALQIRVSAALLLLKAKKSRNSPGVAQRVPGGLGSQIS